MRRWEQRGRRRLKPQDPGTPRSSKNERGRRSPTLLQRAAIRRDPEQAGRLPAFLLAEKREDSRVGEQAVDSAHGSQLGVAEEARDGDLPQSRAQESGVDAGDVVEGSTPPCAVEVEAEAVAAADLTRSDRLEHPLEVFARGRPFAHDEHQRLPLDELGRHAERALGWIEACEVPDEILAAVNLPVGG